MEKSKELKIKINEVKNNMDVYLNFYTRTLFGPKTKYQPKKIGERLRWPSGFAEDDSRVHDVGIIVARKVEPFPSCDTFYLTRVSRKEYNHLMIKAPYLFSYKGKGIGMLLRRLLPYDGFDEFLESKIERKNACHRHVCGRQNA